MSTPTTTPAHRAPVRPRRGPARSQHGRRCACIGCHDAITVTAARGVARLEAWLRGDR